MEMIKKNSYPTCISQMYGYVFNEEERRGKEDEKRKSTSIFCDR